MRILIDECCPSAVAQAFEQAGLDVAQIAMIAPGASDAAVAKLAFDQRRIIVTQDFDFGEMAVRQGTWGAGVVLMACPSMSPSERAARTARIIHKFEDRLEARLTIIEPKRVRQRLLSPMP